MAGKHEKRQYNTTIQTQGLETTTRRLKIEIRGLQSGVAHPCSSEGCKAVDHQSFMAYSLAFF